MIRDTWIGTTAQFLPLPFTQAFLQTPGFNYNQDLTEVIIETAGVYAFSWSTFCEDPIATYLFFNDTISSDSNISVSLFGNHNTVRNLWGEAIIATANNYTSVSLNIVQGEVFIDMASLFIRKLY